MTSLAVWPIAEPITIGDVVGFTITINTDDDISDWEWSAVVRELPDGPVLARWTVEPVGANQIALTLTQAESAKLHDWCGFDVRQTAPVPYTWLTVERMNTRYSYSYEADDA